MSIKEQIYFNFPEPYEKETEDDYINRCKNHLINFPYFIYPHKNGFDYYDEIYNEVHEEYLIDRWKNYNTRLREKYIKSIKTSLKKLREEEFEEIKNFINSL